jgi:hypothetical protein
MGEIAGRPHTQSPETIQMTTPVATPVLTSDDIPVEEPDPPRHRTRIIRSIAGIALAIGIAVYGVAHDGSKDALKDFAKDLKDEPGISTIKPIDMPGYAGALDINHGAATVRAKKEGSTIMLEYQLLDPAGDARVESSIQHAAKEAGFDEKS